MTTAALMTGSPAAAPARAAAPDCIHCGTRCPDDSLSAGGHFFCCAGCRTVYALLHDAGLERFYELDERPGVRIGAAVRPDAYACLDDPAVRRQAVRFSDGRTSRVTFRVPALHCLACVWLLENLFRLRAGIGASQVNFPRREVTISFQDEALRLSELAGLLASLGYPPDLQLDLLQGAGRTASPQRGLHLRLGLAGFAFGNIMLLSFPSYLGLAGGDEDFRGLFGWLSLALALPVLLYSASYYWRAAWQGVRHRLLTIDFPIALGIAALFAESLLEVVRGAGPGYLDSFTGLVFLLLCGRWFQQKTYETLAFDRDYRAYFPLAATRLKGGVETSVPVTRLQPGDVLLLRNQELVPADAVLRRGEARLDYSFVTGESAPVVQQPGDYLYAGGRQVGGLLEVEVVKPTSQSYLAELWNHEAFRKEDRRSLHNLSNRAGRYFTVGILLLASAAGLAWLGIDPTRALRVFSAVLIVACPCALALSAPFALGAALRVLGRHGCFARNTGVLEHLAGITTVLFDKTGTLTLPTRGGMVFAGAPLGEEERTWLRSVVRTSTHPLSRRLEALLGDGALCEAVSVREEAGQGLEATVAGHVLRIGSGAWTAAPADPDPSATQVHLAIDGLHRGTFVFDHVFRPGLAGVLSSLRTRLRLGLVSGDNDAVRSRLQDLFGPGAELRFGQRPQEKLDFIRSRQEAGERVLMVGDGLNDAGALKQSDVGLALTEDVHAFSPACDVILEASRFEQLPRLIAFARGAVAVVLASFALSLAYNVVGLSFAMRGLLSPLVSAVLMPLSSITIILFALAAIECTAWRHRLGRAPSEPEATT